MAIVIRLLTMVLGGSAVSWITSNLMILGIAGAAILVTNLVSGTVWYVKGHNAAALKCKVSTLIRERDELKRDLGVQRGTAEHFSKLAAGLQKREDEREQKGADDVAKLTPVNGCVVPLGVRKPRAK